MTLEQARRIIGNQSTFAIRNMVMALKMCQWLNTEQDWERLEAAKIVLKGKHNG